MTTDEPRFTQNDTGSRQWAVPASVWTDIGDQLIHLHPAVNDVAVIVDALFEDNWCDVLLRVNVDSGKLALPIELYDYSVIADLSVGLHSFQLQAFASSGVRASRVAVRVEEAGAAWQTS